LEAPRTLYGDLGFPMNHQNPRRGATPGQRWPA
jgi:hypothetical protein